MMSRRERRELRLIERNEYATDPQWATLMSGAPYGRKKNLRQLVIIALWVLAASLLVLALVAGVTGLIFAAALVAVMAACVSLGWRNPGPRLVRSP
jgi:hypothetical protein